MTWTKDVVRIRYKRTDKTFGVSSGYALSARKVLTALHVAFDPESRCVRAQLRVMLADRMVPEAEVVSVWPEVFDPEAPDIAVLTLDRDLPDVGPRLLFNDTLPELVERWDSRGFPCIDSPADAAWNREAAGVHGSMERVVAERQLELTADGPEYWYGLSGAPVVWRHYLIGVIEATHENWKGRVFATPVGRLTRLPEFWSAAGLTDDEDELAVREGRGPSPEERIVTLIAKAQLARPLARILDLEEGASAQDIADHLLNSASAADMVRACDELDDLLVAPAAEPTCERGTIRDLLATCLGRACDLATLRVQVRAAIRRDVTRFMLPVWSEALAEAVLAGAEAQPPRWGRTEVAGPDGGAVARVHGLGAILPPPKLLDGDPTSACVAERLVDDLAPKLGVRTRNPAKRATDVGAMLVAKAKLRTHERVRYYLCFNDDDYDADGLDADSVWELVVEGVGNTVPSLWLVRLDGSAGSTLREHGIVLSMSHLFNPLRGKDRVS